MNKGSIDPNFGSTYESTGTHRYRHNTMSGVAAHILDSGVYGSTPAFDQTGHYTQTTISNVHTLGASPSVLEHAANDEHHSFSRTGYQIYHPEDGNEANAKPVPTPAPSSCGSEWQPNRTDVPRAARSGSVHKPLARAGGPRSSADQASALMRKAQLQDDFRTLLQQRNESQSGSLISLKIKQKLSEIAQNQREIEAFEALDGPFGSSGRSGMKACNLWMQPGPATTATDGYDDPGLAWQKQGPSGGATNKSSPKFRFHERVEVATARVDRVPRPAPRLRRKSQHGYDVGHELLGASELDDTIGSQDVRTTAI